MMDYVKGGTKLNFMCAIDFTMSNRHPTDPTSLHHTAPGAFNEYEQAIAAIGGIIMEYVTPHTTHVSLRRCSATAVFVVVRHGWVDVWRGRGGRGWKEWKGWILLL
jgi:hypothetical protein